jgi:hypothetical protein
MVRAEEMNSRNQLDEMTTWALGFYQNTRNGDPVKRKSNL